MTAYTVAAATTSGASAAASASAATSGRYMRAVRSRCVTARDATTPGSAAAKATIAGIASAMNHNASADWMPPT